MCLNTYITYVLHVTFEIKTFHSAWNRHAVLMKTSSENTINKLFTIGQ